MKKEDELLKELTDMVRKQRRGRLSGSFPARLQSTMMRP